MNALDRRQMKINMGMTIPILLAMFISCKNQERIKPEGFVERTVFLEDDYPDTPFCKVNLFIPPEFDTLLKWVDYSDCTCCDLKKYRFTSSKGCFQPMHTKYYNRFTLAPINSDLRVSPS